MVKFREFTEEERLIMYNMKNKDNKSYRTIADHFDCSPTGVMKVVHKIQSTGTVRNLFRSGRKRCTTKRTDRQIVNLVSKQRSITAKEIQNVIQTEKQRVCLKTISNRLHENKFFGGFATKKPKISEKNRKLRLEFAKKYVKMPITFWNRIIWSDESKFELINSKRRIRVYKRRGEGLNPSTTQPTVKHSKSVMVWGCVAGSGVGNLTEVSTKMNAEVYVNILDNNLVQSADELKIRDNFMFQSDNDPKHTSKLAKKWLNDNNIETIEWPPQSPDLTFIENLWDFVDRNITSDKRTSISMFRKAIFETWKNTPQELIDKCVDSIPRRLEAVIGANGLNTNY